VMMKFNLDDGVKRLANTLVSWKWDGVKKAFDNLGIRMFFHTEELEREIDSRIEKWRKEENGVFLNSTASVADYFFMSVESIDREKSLVAYSMDFCELYLFTHKILSTTFDGEGAERAIDGNVIVYFLFENFDYTDRVVDKRFIQLNKINWTVFLVDFDSYGGERD